MSRSNPITTTPLAALLLLAGSAACDVPGAPPETSGSAAPALADDFAPPPHHTRPHGPPTPEMLKRMLSCETPPPFIRDADDPELAEDFKVGCLARRERLMKQFDADQDGELSDPELDAMKHAMREKMRERIRSGHFPPGPPPFGELPMPRPLRMIRDELPMSDRILLVEDDAELGAQIVDHLVKAGFSPTWWRAGRPLDAEAVRGFSLLILDLMLPGTYGMDMLKGLRELAETPVLILSARNDTADKVRALRLGADDYMTKPFWPEELIERVRARLRRPVMMKSSIIQVGPIRIDSEARSVEVDGIRIELTRVELDLLLALAKRPGAAITRRNLAENALDPEREGTERTIDVHVSRLRKKLGLERMIETVWGIGYRLNTEEPR